MKALLAARDAQLEDTQHELQVLVVVVVLLLLVLLVVVVVLVLVLVVVLLLELLLELLLLVLLVVVLLCILLCLLPAVNPEAVPAVLTRSWPACCTGAPQVAGGPGPQTPQEAALGAGYVMSLLLHKDLCCESCGSPCSNLSLYGSGWPPLLRGPVACRGAQGT